MTNEKRERGQRYAELRFPATIRVAVGGFAFEAAVYQGIRDFGRPGILSTGRSAGTDDRDKKRRRCKLKRSTNKPPPGPLGFMIIQWPTAATLSGPHSPYTQTTPAKLGISRARPTVFALLGVLLVHNGAPGPGNCQ